MGDGKYELRVTASDNLSNPATSALETARISEPVVVDNTAPSIAMLAGKADGKTITIRGRARDQLSRITGIEYSIDSATEWVPVLPTDGICDSRDETFSFEITDAKSGSHRVAVRLRDAYGNVAYRAVTITVGDQQ